MASNLFDSLRQGMEFHRLGQLSEAEHIYRGVLAEQPDQIDALHMLGLIAHACGAHDAAIALIQQVIDRQPHFPDFHNSLGVALKGAGQIEEAVASYQRAIELRPVYPEAYRNLEIALRALGEVAKADEAAAARQQFAPNHAAAQVNLGCQLFQDGRYDEAQAAFQRALELEPANPYAYRNLWLCYSRDGRREQAAAILRDWKKHHPDHAFADFMVTALTGSDTPDRMPAAVVKDMFDSFSESFDDNLASVNYRGPEIVANALEMAVGAPDASLDILDAGCGTGLCAPRLQPFARRMTGIDLSAAMLGKAALRGAYDELVEGDLADFLLAHPVRFDAIISGDTLVYFGDLANLCALAYAALRPAGYFIFTVERADADPDSYSLGREGRYSHGEAYLRRVLAGAGFFGITLGIEPLRYEARQPVAAFVVTAQKPGVPD